MDAFDALMRGIRACRDCEEKFGFTPHPVVHGSARSKIFALGQAPSSRGHASGKPYDDDSGKKLRQWLDIPAHAFYDENSFFFTAMAHCYPGKAKGGGDKTPPARCAKKWLPREMALVDNRLYLLIGGIAAKYFFPKESFSTLVFRDMRLNDKPALILPHPSPLNIKWFKDNPAFMENRLPQIRAQVHRALSKR